MTTVKGAEFLGTIYELLSNFSEDNIDQALENVKLRLSRKMDSDEVRMMFEQLEKTVVELKKLKILREV